MPLSTGAKVGLGVTAIVIGATVWLIHHKQAVPEKQGPAPHPAPPPHDLLPVPAQAGASGTVWAVVAENGGSFRVKRGETYRASANINVSISSVNKSDIVSYMQANGWSNVTVYAPGETWPSGWNQPQGAWGVEALRSGPDTDVPATTNKVVVTVRVDEVLVKQVRSSTTPDQEVHVIQPEAAVALTMKAGQVLRVRLLPPTAGTAWLWLEDNDLAVIIGQYTDAQTGEVVTDLRLKEGQGKLVAELGNQSTLVATFTAYCNTGASMA